MSESLKVHKTMEIPSIPTMGHGPSIKVPISPTRFTQSTCVSPSTSDGNSFHCRAKKIVGISPFAERNIGFAPVPVTPDPNSSSKSIVRGKAIKKTRGREGHFCQPRLNKFVKRLHEMLIRERHSGIVEWRRGLLVLFSTDSFTKKILPKYFNTRNFKTFRRQLNYYGFVHVRSFSATGNTTTALWINQHLAEDEANDDVSAVLKLRRVEPDEVVKTVEGRRLRKELAIHTVEEDIGLNSKTLQMDQIRSMAVRGEGTPRQQQIPSSFPNILRPRGKTLNLVDSEDSISSKRKALIYSSNDKTSTTGKSSGIVPLMPNLTDEVANTDAAANVLLMLSRS